MFIPSIFLTKELRENEKGGIEIIMNYFILISISVYREKRDK